MRRTSAVLAGALACAGLSGCANAGSSHELTVFAAASLTEPFTQIARGFEDSRPGVEVTVVHGGSSSLAAQIVAGAPADVFASADDAQMTAVAPLVAGEPAMFATNTLTVVVPAGNPAGVTSLADLADPAVVSVICAVQVPCGAGARTLASLEGVTLRPASEEGSVTDVLGKVETGQADAGVVYATDVQRARGVEEVVIEGADQVVAHYPIAALNDAADASLANAFVAYVTSDAGQAVLASHGFGAP